MAFRDLLKINPADLITTYNGKKLRDAYPENVVDAGRQPRNLAAIAQSLGGMVAPEQVAPNDPPAQTMPILEPTAEDAARTFAPQSRMPIPPPPETPNANAPTSLPLSQQYQNQINAINQKDYSKAQYDADGNLVKKPGDSRDRDWSWKEKLAGAVLPILESIGRGQGAIAGAGDAVRGATNRNFFEQREDASRLSRLLPQQQQAMAQEQFQNTLETAKVNRQNTIEDNNRAREEFKQRMEYNRSEQARKIGDRQSREQTARMNQVANIFKNIPSFDPNDPKFADLRNALGDVNLPVTPKDAKKNVKLVQDQRTGAWTTVLTSPTDGKQEVRAVLDKDGNQLKTTPTVVMQGEYGMLRQDDQQAFTAGENEKNRQQRSLEFQEKLKLAKQKIGQTAETYKLARERFELAKSKGENTTMTQKQINDGKIKIVNARRAIQADLTMTDEEKQELFNLLPDTDNE